MSFIAVVQEIYFDFGCTFVDIKFTNIYFFDIESGLVAEFLQ